MNHAGAVSVGDEDIAVAAEALLGHGHPRRAVLAAVAIVRHVGLFDVHHRLTVERRLDDLARALIGQPQTFAAVLLDERHAVGAGEPIAPAVDQLAIGIEGQHRRVGLIEDHHVARLRHHDAVRTAVGLPAGRLRNSRPVIDPLVTKRSVAKLHRQALISWVYCIPPPTGGIIGRGRPKDRKPGNQK